MKHLELSLLFALLALIADIIAEPVAFADPEASADPEAEAFGKYFKY